MEKAQISLPDIEKLTQGRFVYIQDYMNPIKSHVYGHAGGCSVVIKEHTDLQFRVEYNTGIIEKRLVEKTNLFQELKKYEREYKMRKLFSESKPPEYNNILMLAAFTINPYVLLTTEEKKEKVRIVFMKHRSFDTLEQVDLFLVGLARVNQFISFETFGRLEINFFANKWGDYFVIDKDADEVIISKEPKEIERFILRKMKMQPELGEEKENG